MKHFKEVKENFWKTEEFLSEYATKSEEAVRLVEVEDDIRTPFFRDVDRIIHALSYTRYVDKTQVYSFQENDHISKRMVHVQLVSKIARTIGRALKLNTDLIEAIALGHDIGHTPLGHTGEALLNEISERELGESFTHNIQGVRHYMEVENDGKGLNLTIQVLDGIMCHNGEIPAGEYTPIKKSKEEFLKQYHNAYHDLATSIKNHPMTLEGCVVRISDIIGYIGRDIEDAIEIGVIEREEIPKNIQKVLGVENRKIVDTLIRDIIENSLGKPYIKMSSSVYEALFELKEFNYKHIYLKANTKEQLDFYEEKMNLLYKECLHDIETNNKKSSIYQVYLKDANPEYLKNTDPKRIAIDYISGMTDEFFMESIQKIEKETMKS